MACGCRKKKSGANDANVQGCTGPNCGPKTTTVLKTPKTTITKIMPPDARK